VGEARGGVKSLVSAWPYRRDAVVVVAGGDEQAAQREADEVARPVVRPRPRESEWRDRHDDETGVRVRDRREVQTERAQLGRVQGAHEDVSVDEQPVEVQAAVRVREIEDHAALVPVVVPVGEAALRIGDATDERSAVA
jgi:hypothetical protein